MPFVLPQNYSPAVSEGLKHGSLTGKAMVKFITEISHALFSFKSYPTAEERDHVARQCVKKFPFLEASCGTGYGYISIGLEERLKYLRRPLKRPQKCASTEGTPPTKRPPKAVMPHSSSVCVMAEGEDEDSHQRNVDKLKSFYKQHHPDPAIVKDLMDRTFTFRRTRLQDPSMQYTIHSFLTAYPFLNKIDEFMNEFSRVVEAHHTSFLGCKLKWMDVQPLILEVAEKERDQPVLKAMLDHHSDSTDEGTLTVLALILLTYLVPDARTKADHTRVIKVVPDEGGEH
jgi:hypothetical protein